MIKMVDCGDYYWPGIIEYFTAMCLGLRNLSYLHANFDHICRVWIILTLSKHDAYLKFFATYAPFTGRSAETYRIIIAYLEKEVHNIRQTDVFCVDKTSFLRPWSFNIELD